jgi:hypothetical protein
VAENATACLPADGAMILGIPGCPPSTSFTREVSLSRNTRGIVASYQYRLTELR